MNCLIELCFVSAMYINGGIGFQAQDELILKHDRTNSYGKRLAELSLVVEFKNNAYIELKHISGIDSGEIDHGLNAIMIGAKIYLFKGNE